MRLNTGHTIYFLLLFVHTRITLIDCFMSSACNCCFRLKLIGTHFPNQTELRSVFGCELLFEYKPVTSWSTHRNLLQNMHSIHYFRFTISISSLNCLLLDRPGGLPTQYCFCYIYILHGGWIYCIYIVFTCSGLFLFWKLDNTPDYSSCIYRHMHRWQLRLTNYMNFAINCYYYLALIAMKIL